MISESFMELLTIQVKDLLIMKSKMKTKVRIPQCNYLRCYAFGSVVYSDNPSDIDVVIIYDKTRMSIDDAIQYRHRLEQELSMVFDKNIDTLLLSEEEEIEMEFLENAKTIPLN